MATLILAEKPSVARSIARAIGVAGRGDGYLEGGGYIVSWCVGHLVGLAAADCYDPRYSRWAREDLPILPEPWQYTVSPATKKQFDIVKGLMGRPDVSDLVAATDAGREGELIFRLVYNQAGCRKPFKRLWISSMEDSAIREGFRNLLPGERFGLLYEAALCRAKADWMVGINATRLFTTLYGGKTLNVGRVMTPTLALVTDRERVIAGFKKEKFYTVELDCGVFHAAGGRFSSKTEAEKLRKACLGRTAVVQGVERRERTEEPPGLYDLTALQREANRLYGYTAQQTLDYVQALYEKKFVTYPRTDSRYLTEDMGTGLPALCQAVAGAFPFGPAFYGAVNADQVTDNSKVSDHHAIIPTEAAADVKREGLPTGEWNILSLLSARILCAACPDRYRYAETSVTVSCAGAEFTAGGREELSAGWKVMERAFLAALKGKAEEGMEEKMQVPLPGLVRGQELAVGDVLLREGTTVPPKRYTEDSLLAAMENAGAGRAAQAGDAGRRGIGTPATRAGVIEKLVKGGFVERKNRFLLPTVHGMELVKVLPDTLKSAELTAEWEEALKEVERGERRPEDFLEGIADMVRGLVESYDGVAVDAGGALSGSGKKEAGKCPRCGKAVYEGKKGFCCSGYKDNPPCGFALWKDNPYFKGKRKELTGKVVAALLENGKVKMEGLYSEKKGIFYDATVVMEDTGGKYVNFRLEFGPEDKRGRK